MARRIGWANAAKMASRSKGTADWLTIWLTDMHAGYLTIWLSVLFGRYGVPRALTGKTSTKISRARGENRDEESIEALLRIGLSKPISTENISAENVRYPGRSRGAD